MPDWQSLIDLAASKGFKVEQAPEGYWTVITPKRPRRASEVHASWKDSRAAWRAASGMAQDF